MPPLKKFSPEIIRVIARNPVVDLQLIGMKWTQYKDNHYTKISENLLKPQVFQIFTHKITADIAKILKTIDILTVKSTVRKIFH